MNLSQEFAKSMARRRICQRAAVQVLMSPQISLSRPACAFRWANVARFQHGSLSLVGDDILQWRYPEVPAAVPVPGAGGGRLADMVAAHARARCHGSRA